MTTKYTLPEYDFPMFDNWGSVLIVWFALVVYVVLVEAYIAEKKYIRQHAPGHSKWPARIGLSIVAVVNTVGIVFVIVLAVLGYQSTVQEYETVVEGYHRGEYQIVEGNVENFSPMPQAGHGIESFTVNGVDFEYTFSKTVTPIINLW